MLIILKGSFEIVSYLKKKKTKNFKMALENQKAQVQSANGRSFQQSM